MVRAGKWIVTGACVALLAGSAWAEVPLKDSVLASLKHHPQIQAEKNAREAAKEDLSSAKGGYLPSVDVTAGYGTEQYSSVTTRASGRDDDFRERWDSKVTATQLLWDGNATPSRVGFAEASLDAAGTQLKDVAQTIGLDAIIAHLTVYRQRELVVLAEENVDQHRTILQSMEEREQQGVGSLADVTQTSGRLARALTTLSETQSSLDSAIANYYRLTGMMPEELDASEFPAQVPADLEGAVQRSLENNPAVSTRQSRVVAAEEQISLNKAAYYPDFRFEASTTHTDQASGADSHTTSNQARVTMNWNLFNGGSDVADVSAARSRKSQANMLLKDTREALTELTTSTWSTYQATEEQVGLYERAVEYNRQTRDMYLEQFNVGQRSLLDVLDAENELFNTQGQLVTARTNLLISAYRLITLNGDLLTALSIADGDYDAE